MKIPNLIVFDIETLGLSYEKSPVIQLAALAINWDTLKPYQDGWFSSMICPDDLEAHRHTPEAKAALDVNKKTFSEIEKAPGEAAVWQGFVDFCKRFRKPGITGAPSPAGKNIREFDLRFVDRYAVKHKFAGKDGRANIFNRRYTFDIEDDLVRWFGASSEVENLKMDTLRPYLGLSSDQSHDARQDVADTAIILVSYLETYRKLFKPEKFRGALAGRTL